MHPEQEACTGSVHRYTLHGDAQGAYIGMCCSRCGTQHLFLLNFTQLLTAQPSHSSELLCETSPPLRQLLLTHLQPYSECVQVLCAVTSEHWRRTGPPMEPGGAWLCTALALPAACPGVLKPLGQPLSGFRDRSSHGGVANMSSRALGHTVSPKEAGHGPVLARTKAGCCTTAGLRPTAGGMGEGKRVARGRSGCWQHGGDLAAPPAPGTLGSSGSTGTWALGCLEPPGCHFLHGSRGCAAAAVVAWV